MAVYFIRAVETDRVKIGYTSRKPFQRLHDMQTGCPEKLKIEFVWPDGTREDEAHYHEIYKKYRIHGEWFHFHPQISADLDSWDKLQDKLIRHQLREQGVFLCP